MLGKAILWSSVLDPWHFGTDPYPWIRTTDLRIRILLFSSVADKMPTKNYFFSPSFFAYYCFEDIFTSVFVDKKSKRSHKKIRIHTRYDGSGRPKNIRIRIRSSRMHDLQLLMNPDPEKILTLLYKIAPCWFSFIRNSSVDSKNANLLSSQALLAIR